MSEDTKNLRRWMESVETALDCATCEGSGNVDGGVCGSCRGKGLATSDGVAKAVDDERRRASDSTYTTGARLKDIIDESFGMQPVMTDEESLSFLERKLFEQRRVSSNAPTPWEKLAELGRDFAALGYVMSIRPAVRVETSEGQPHDVCECGHLRSVHGPMCGYAAQTCECPWFHSRPRPGEAPPTWSQCLVCLEYTGTMACRGCYEKQRGADVHDPADSVSGPGSGSDLRDAPVIVAALVEKAGGELWLTDADLVHAFGLRLIVEYPAEGGRIYRSLPVSGSGGGAK